jgi:hypothetical protein
VMVLDSPFWSAKPVVGSAGTPALDRMPGHTVYSHLFTIVKVVEITPDIDRTSVNNDTNNAVSGAIEIYLNDYNKKKKEVEKKKLGGCMDAKIFFSKR